MEIPVLSTLQMLHNAVFLLNSGFSDNPAVVCISEIRPKPMPILVPIRKILPPINSIYRDRETNHLPKIGKSFWIS